MDLTTGLPREWSRGPQWANEAARAEWEPVLRRAQEAWGQIELGSITEGLRGSALVHLTADELPRAARETAAQGLALAVLEAGPGTAPSFRVAVHRPGLAVRWHLAWSSRDDDAVGELLGFPACCRAHFLREWAGRGAVDMVPADPDGPWEANILLRWLGVRLVPHLPCSGACEETVAQARRYLEAGRRLGADVHALEALLRLPVTFSTLNGLGIVETPHFRIMVAADEGPTEARKARSGASEGAVWADNGFSSLQAMEAAHAVVAEAVGDVGSALDLGCGDGALLARLAAGRPGRWVGIEADPARAARGASRRPEVSILCGRIEDAEEDLASLAASVDVVLLMPGRLLEMAPDDAERVRQALRGRRIVAYAYTDWLKEGLYSLCSEAGLHLSCGVRHEGQGVAAGAATVYDPEVHYDGALA